MTQHFQTPATLRSLREIVAEYEAKAGAIPASLAAFKQAATDLETASCIGGTYAGSIWWKGSPNPAEQALSANLLKSAWLHVYRGLNIPEIASANDRSRFEMAIENPAPFTLDNIAATFGDYVKNPRFHILKGLAECFCDLDPAYKSHSKVKIGVAGLPKRIILRSVSDYGSWGYDRLRDALTALQTFRGKPHPEHRELSDLLRDAQEHGASYYHGIEIRRFQNGNAHLIFDQETLREINLALAEFYGDTLPDSPEEAPRKRASTAVSADLAYYPTPQAVIDTVLGALSLRDVKSALEPSCGDGRIMDALREKGIGVTGCEYDTGRAEEARAKGHHVIRANFLQTAPTPVFDLVVMNPPFCGRHWRKHLDHARKFLKPGGTLACILPASAYYDGHLDDLLPRKKWRDGWTDLPVASFAESGTNIPTGFAVLAA